MSESGLRTTILATQIINAFNSDGGFDIDTNSHYSTKKNLSKVIAEIVDCIASLEDQVSHLKGFIKRREDEGNLAECPFCGSLDIGGAVDNVHCYGCKAQISATPPLQNAMDAWNTRGGTLLTYEKK